MSITIQRNDTDFLYQQVVKMVREMSGSGTLRPGDKLPSLRGFSQRLNVSVPTVRQAYAELERLGLIEARPKSGYFLRAASVSQPLQRADVVRRPRQVNRQSLIEDVFDAIHTPGNMPLGIANPSSAYPSDKTLARIMRQVLSRAGSSVLAYGPMYGYEPLKRQLAMRYLDHGLQISPDEVIVTNGAQEAITIALQCVAARGDVIAVESPTYFGVLELIERLGMKAIEIPLCPEDGICLADLRQVIDNHQISACVFSSSISNPIGSFMPRETCRNLVNLLEQYNIPFIEDDVYGDLYFTEQRGSLAHSFSTKGQVLTCASFSKTAAPGFRVGWLIAGQYSEKAKGLKRAYSCSSPYLNQWVMSEFVASGEYDRNIRVLRQRLHCYKDRAIAAIQASFPEGTRVSDPKGAGVLWAELPEGLDGEDLFRLALEHRISVAPGRMFSPSNKYRRCVRLSYGLQWSDAVDEAFAILGQLVGELQNRL